MARATPPTQAESEKTALEVTGDTSTTTVSILTLTTWRISICDHASEYRNWQLVQRGLSYGLTQRDSGWVEFQLYHESFGERNALQPALQQCSAAEVRRQTARHSIQQAMCDSVSLAAVKNWTVRQDSATVLS